ncbi:histone acetylase complex subunit [Aphelenchoides avenae]|nr:histone acetylase complex subunit [Aphelenchus avenae]
MNNAPVINVPAVNVDELTVGTKILSLWNRELYAATIIEIRGVAPKRKFKIRYEGYTAKDDSTVREADVPNRFGVYVPVDGVQPEPANEANSVTSDDRQETDGASKRNAADRDAERLQSPPSGSKDAGAAAASRSRCGTSRNDAKKSRSDPVDAAMHSTLHISLHITEQQLVKLPLSLQKVLVKDRDAINVHGKWTKLPARVSVQQILDEYVESLEAVDLEKAAPESEMPITLEKLRESAVAMRQLFDRVLPLRFLYDVERRQYEKVAEQMKRYYLARKIAKKATMSELYGLPHLLRALVFVDDFLFETNWSQPAVDYLRMQVKYLLGFLGSKVDLGEYVVDDADFVDGNAAGDSELND